MKNNPAMTATQISPHAMWIGTDCPHGLVAHWISSHVASCAVVPQARHRLLGARNRALHQIPHQRNLVGVELQRHRALRPQLAGHLAGLRVRRLAAHRIFHGLQPHRPRRHRIHRNADVADRVCR